MFSFVSSCAFKPLYKKTNSFSNYKINIIVKSKDYYENNVSMMKLFLNQKLNKKGSKKSSLKLIVSIDRSVSNIGIKKDLSSDARIVRITIIYSFYDKKGELSSGSLKNSASFNYTMNNYANMVSLEDASSKLIKSLSSDLANLLISGSFNRNINP